MTSFFKISRASKIVGVLFVCAAAVVSEVAVVSSGAVGLVILLPATTNGIASTNGTKAILDGADFSELKEEIARLKVRKAELEEILSTSPDLLLTKEMIADKLKKDAQSLQDGDIKRLLKFYVTGIYAHSDEIIITGGVNIDHCGRRI